MTDVEIQVRTVRVPPDLGRAIAIAASDHDVTHGARVTARELDAAEGLDSALEEAMAMIAIYGTAGIEMLDRYPYFRARRVRPTRRDA